MGSPINRLRSPRFSFSNSLSRFAWTSGGRADMVGADTVDLFRIV